MKLHRYVDHQRLHIVTKAVISLSISVLLLFRHYISHKITFGAPSSGGVLCSACGAFIFISFVSTCELTLFFISDAISEYFVSATPPTNVFGHLKNVSMLNSWSEYVHCACGMDIIVIFYLQFGNFFFISGIYEHNSSFNFISSLMRPCLSFY